MTKIKNSCQIIFRRAVTNRRQEMSVACQGRCGGLHSYGAREEVRQAEALSYIYGIVGKVFVVQARGTEFRSQEPRKKLGMVVCAVLSGLGGRDKRILGI